MSKTEFQRGDAETRRDGAGIEILRFVWKHNKTTAWETLNHSLRHTLHIAIAAGMTFAPEDFTEINECYRPGYWLCEDGFELPYAWAIAYRNTSFIKAFEAFKKRKPFIANNVVPREPYPKIIHRLGTRERGRLALWFEFGGGYRVTSIRGDVLIAVIERPERKVVRFTHAKLKELFPAPKKAKNADSTKECEEESP